VEYVPRIALVEIVVEGVSQVSSHINPAAVHVHAR